MSHTTVRTVTIDYTNWRGLRALRRIEPHRLVFENNEWHPETQWHLEADDLDRGIYRSFAMAQIHSWAPEGRQHPVDVSLVRQLQRSMELNARMKNRIGLLLSRAGPDMIKAFIDGLQKILKDEDPTDGI